MAINPDLTRLRKEIDRLLAEKRPDRYTVRDSTVTNDEEVENLDVEEAEDSDWLDDIAAEVEDLVPDEELRKLYARKIVGQQEGKATTRANKLLRKIHRFGQLVLGWYGVKDDPVAVVTRTVGPDGQSKVREERVALRAMTARDFRDFATEERRRAANDFSARNDACAGAEWVADQMTVAGALHFEAWAEEEMPQI
jgi:hypothetical protein